MYSLFCFSHMETFFLISIFWENKENCQLLTIRWRTKLFLYKYQSNRDGWLISDHSTFFMWPI